METEATTLAIAARNARTGGQPLDADTIQRIESELWRAHANERAKNDPGFWTGFIAGTVGGGMTAIAVMAFKLLGA